MREYKICLQLIKLFQIIYWRNKLTHILYTLIRQSLVCQAKAMTVTGCLHSESIPLKITARSLHYDTAVNGSSVLGAFGYSRSRLNFIFKSGFSWLQFLEINFTTCSYNVNINLYLKESF